MKGGLWGLRVGFLGFERGVMGVWLCWVFGCVWGIEFDSRIEGKVLIKRGVYIRYLGFYGDFLGEKFFF